MGGNAYHLNEVPEESRPDKEEKHAVRLLRRIGDTAGFAIDINFKELSDEL